MRRSPSTTRERPPPGHVDAGHDVHRRGLEDAVEELTGKDVTVGKWGYDPYAGIYFDPEVYPAPLGEPDDSGFQVMFAGDPDPYTDGQRPPDMHALIVTPSAGVTVNVGETAKGGPSDNAGDSHRTGNHAPVVTAPANRTLPLRTPFTLRGSATDADGDRLTYLWEQNDIGGSDGTALVDNAKRNGPLFRVFGLYADVSDEDASQSPAPGENIAGTSPSRPSPTWPRSWTETPTPRPAGARRRRRTTRTSTSSCRSRS